jgi:putative transposase
MFTFANQLVANYDCIGIGDYTPKKLGNSSKMRRAMNNRSLHGNFKDVLNWAGKKSGKTVTV